MAEKEVMVQARHPFILQLVSTMKDDQKLYMLLEICLGGELFTYLHCSGRPTEYVEDHHARFYAACVLDAFEYLHDKNIVYRDLKPENLMLDSVGYIKVVDFGFAKVVTTRTYTLCGTPEYLAPELVTGRGHNKGVDYWAFGVLIYEMVTGYSPFAGPETPEQSVIVRNILRGKCNYPSTIKNPQCTSIIKALLVKEQSRRLGCLKGGSRDIKNHKWFTGLDWDVLRAKTEPAPFQPPIKDSLDTSNFDPWEEPDDEEFYYDDGTNWDAKF
jgi:serine/threonine protein kinase